MSLVFNDFLVVFCHRVFRFALLHEHVAPRLEWIRPVRAALVRIPKFPRGAIEIALPDERDAPRVIPRR